MTDHPTKQTTAPLQRLRDLALAELGPMALPSERTDIMMWAADEIERLREIISSTVAELQCSYDGGFGNAIHILTGQIPP